MFGVMILSQPSIFPFALFGDPFRRERESIYMQNCGHDWMEPEPLLNKRYGGRRVYGVYGEKTNFINRKLPFNYVVLCMKFKDSMQKHF